MTVTVNIPNGFVQ